MNHGGPWRNPDDLDETFARVVADTMQALATPSLKGAKTLFAHEIRVLAPFRLSARYRNGSTANLRSRGQSATS
jgi:hypothetical protein